MKAKEFDIFLNISGAEFVDDFMSMKIDIVGSAVRIWPIGIDCDQSEEYSIIIQTNQEKTLDLYCNDKCLIGNILPIFMFLDNGLKVMSIDESDFEINISAIKNGKQLDVCPFKIRNSENDIGIMSEEKEIEISKKGMVALKINVKSPAQLVVDLKTNNDSKPKNSIVIDHNDGYANVYRDVLENGIWNSEARIKMGWFKYSIDNPYNLAIIQKDGEIQVSVSSNGKISAIQRKADIKNTEFESIIIRTSSSTIDGSQGHFEVEPYVL